MPVPRVENVATKSDAKLIHLMVVTLLERGEPMSLDTIAERLRVAGVTAATGDMETSLLKSWHGSKPVFRDDRRKLTITPELLITGSTGISRPLGDPAKIAEYLAGDQRTKLRRRLESDVKSLFAFYNYGILHRRVRLRWGFLDEGLGVDWALPGDPALHGVLEERQASGQEVEIVYGSAPGWSDPWSRSVRVKVLSFETYRRYNDILDLFRSCLESYWPGHDQEEHKRITDGGGTYCGTFGPDEIAGGLSEFLGYFMPHKVVAAKETMKAAGTVTKKLMQWLAEKGYVPDDEGLQLAAERAGDAARDLPASQDVVTILEAYVDENVPEDYSQEIEDHFMVSRIEPGKLWLEPFVSGDLEIGPVPVPREVTDLCQVGWDISGVAAKTRRGWRLLEVWNVSP